MEISPHPLGITSLRGSDAAQFLQGYVTSDTDALHENKAMPTAFTDLKGRVLANGWIFGTSNNVQLILHRSTIKLIHNHLKKYLVFAQSQFVEEIKPISISTAKESEVGYPTLEPYRWSTSSKEQQPNQDIEYLVSKNIVLIQQETSSLFLPQMIGLTTLNAVSFKKGCYLGQEIIARAEHRGVVKKQLQSYVWTGVKPTVGAKATNELGKAIVVTVTDTCCLIVASKNLSGALVGNDFLLEPANQHKT